MTPLRIGFVPEHFSTPLHFAVKHHGLQADLVPFPSGTGHMITAIRAGEIDVGIGLTEAWISGLGKEDVEGDGGYRLVGTYVQSPLCWAISTGAHRDDIRSVDDLRGSKLGVSRIGSGSYVMGYVLADQQQQQQQRAWPSPPFSSVVPLQTFEQLRAGVNARTADFFMWEHFTSSKFYASGEIKRVGEIYTPWSSWKIVAATWLAPPQQRKQQGGDEGEGQYLYEGGDGGGGSLDARLGDLFEKLDRGVRHFREHPEEAVEWIATNLEYSREDAREWMRTVRFADRTEGVDRGVVEGCVDILRKAGVLAEGKGMSAQEMVFSR